MSAPEIDPQLASTIAEQKRMLSEHGARWARRFWICLLAGSVTGIGSWFLQSPMDREWEFALVLGTLVSVVGISCLCLFTPLRCTPKCPQCGHVWIDEGDCWPAWKHCPGCGLKMSDDTGDSRQS